jgi:hypothetical protein
MSNIYTGSTKDASYQISIHLPKRFQRRFLEINQSETRMACGGHGSIVGTTSIKNAHLVAIHKQTCPPQTILASDWLISKKSSLLKPLGQMASYQVSIHLAMQFQRRRFKNI